jgi:hypothetical protein
MCGVCVGVCACRHLCGYRYIHRHLQAAWPAWRGKKGLNLIMQIRNGLATMQICVCGGRGGAHACSSAGLMDLINSRWLH